MSADELEPTRYVGRRLRSWRHERNWSGREAASHLVSSLHRPVEWTELLRYEEGSVLPDTPTATQLAAIYGRNLADLLTLNPPAAPVVTVPWPPQTPSSEDLAAVRALLESRGLDPLYAERFFQLGLSKASTGVWLRAFSPEDAFGWIAVRFGPNEAAKWADHGHTVDEAIRLKSLGLAPGLLSVSGDQRLSELGVAVEVIVARGQLGVDGDKPESWVERGWDLLASISWLLAGFDPSSARTWDEQGFDPLWAKALAASFGPVEAGRWRNTAVDTSAWEEWRALGFQPSEAEVFAEADFAVTEAAEWRDTGFSQNEAVAYRGVGLDAPVVAGRWRAIGVSARDVHLWLDLDLEPSVLERWRTLSADPTVIANLVKSGLSPGRARPWLAAGVDPRSIEQWEAAGFAPEGAREWAGTSPDRARRLLASGISPDFDRSRRASGAARVAAARAALAERRGPAPRDQRSAGIDSQRPKRDLGTFTPGCGACGRPVSVNGRCGCS